MFRPPEYAALINPMHNAFDFQVASPEWLQHFQAVIDSARSSELSCPLPARLGPKEWSPIGEYKLKEQK